jgi:thiamine-phosphate pyrophosphorylase
MHTNDYRIFYFIDELNKDKISKLSKKTSVIYRNYKKNYNDNEIREIQKLCKSLKLKLNLDGAYVPSFDNSLRYIFIRTKKNIELIGSAHNFRELFHKKKQGIDTIVLSPIFKNTKKNSMLGINKFNAITKFHKFKYVALGGIKKNNIKLLKNLNCIGFASISYINSLFN